MASKPKTVTTDAGLKLEAIRGPKLDKLDRVTWYYRARRHGRGGETVWSGWATPQAAPSLADAALLALAVQQEGGATVGEVLEAWLRHQDGRAAKGELGRETARMYRTRVTKQLAPILGAVPIGDLTNEHLAEASRIMREDDEYAIRTVDQTMRSVFGSAMAWARRQGIPVPEVVIKPLKPVGYINNKTIPTDDQIRKVLLCIADPVEQLAIELMVVTGCRVGSVANSMEKILDARNGRGLRVEDVHPLSESLHIRGKTGPRDVPIPKRVMAKLERHLIDDPPGDDPRVFRFRDKRGNGAIIAGPRQRLQTVLREACVAADVPAFTPHSLRNAAGIRALRAGKDPAAVARYLGMSLRVLLEVYDRVTMETKRGILESTDLGDVAPAGQENVLRFPGLSREN